MPVSTSEKIWGCAVNRILPPPTEKTIWTTNPTKLTLVLVEFRDHKWMRGVLWNIAHVYGGSEVGLAVVCGKGNRKAVEKIVGGWQGIQIIEYPYQNIDRRKYSEILSQPTFYDHFSSEFILIFQTDTLTISRFPDKFYSYDYVGAPWKNNRWKRPVGNGGYSLRRREAMREICIRIPNTKVLHEDVYFATNTPLSRLPTASLARQFSVEAQYYRPTCAMHQAYRFLNPTQMRTLIGDLSPMLRPHARKKGGR